MTLAQLAGVSRTFRQTAARTAHALLQTGQAAKAERIFTALCALDAYDAYAHFGLGACLQRLGRPAEAEAAYARALVLQPGNTAARTNRAEVLLVLGRVEEARAQLAQACATTEPRYRKWAVRAGALEQACQRAAPKR